MTLTTPEEDIDLLCSHFDESAKFQTFCPSSTLCMKRTVQYKSKSKLTISIGQLLNNVTLFENFLLASVITTVQRDCAPQKYTSHVYNDVDKQWDKKEEIITTAYDEGCFIGENRGAPTGPPEYCFCSFHLCNSSSQIGMFNKIYGTILALLIAKLM